MSISRSCPLPELFLDPDRIRIARTRRGLNKSDLARSLGVTPRTVARYEAGEAPPSAASRLADVLEFPERFFFTGDAPILERERVDFRTGRRACARQREAGMAAGAIGIEIDQWISGRFVLPTVDVPDLAGEEPVQAARLVRDEWALGSRPAPNMVQLLESRGVRVYTLPAMADEVDAFSTWYRGKPYVFLSRRRSPEEVRFDIAHELGHLVLHAVPGDRRSKEREADAFAAELLVPDAAVPEYLRRDPTVADLLDARDRFKVPAMFLAKAVHRAGRMTDWGYRQTCLELVGRGFRNGEPGGMPMHEVSRVFPQVFRRGAAAVTAQTIADDVHVPVDEIRALTFGVELRAAAAADAPVAAPGGTARPELRLV